MRCFVTGATGFVGGHVARLLLDARHEVVVLARDRGRADGLAARGAVICHGDVTDKASMREAMRGADAVLHIAAWYKVGARDHSRAREINVAGTRNVLELMQELHVPRGVYTSTVGVNSDTGGRVVDESYRHHGPWLSFYERTKWEAHFEVAEPMMAAGLPLVVVMPSLVYGPGDTGPPHDFLMDFLLRRLLVLPQRTAFAWGYVEDIARGHILALEKGRPGETYILAGPVHTMEQAVTELVRLTGLPARALRPGPRTVRALAAAMDLVGKVAPLPPLYAGETLRSIAGTSFTATSAKAGRELGFTARGLAAGFRDTLLHELPLLGRKDLVARVAAVPAAEVSV